MHPKVADLCKQGRHLEAIKLILDDEQKDRSSQLFHSHCDALFQVGVALLSDKSVDSARQKALLTMIIGMLLQRGDIEPEHIHTLVTKLPEWNENFKLFLERIEDIMHNIIMIRLE
jgi:hypothetical protein